VLQLCVGIHGLKTLTECCEIIVPRSISKAQMKVQNHGFSVSDMANKTSPVILRRVNFARDDQALLLDA
jgi:hypothetical protein